MMKDQRWSSAVLAAVGVAGLAMGWAGSSLTGGAVAITDAAAAGSAAAEGTSRRALAMRAPADLKDFMSQFTGKPVSGGKRREFLADTSTAADLLTLPQIKEFLKGLNSQGDSAEKRAAQRVLLNRWAVLDPNSLIAAYQNQAPGKMTTMALRAALSEMAKDDPSAAIAKVGSLATALGGDKDSAIRGMLRAAASTQPEAAWEAYSQSALKADRSLGNSILETWISKDPAGAWPIVDAMPAGWERRSLIGNFAVKYGESNPEQGITWAQALGNPAERDSALTAVLESWTDRDVTAAATYLETAKLAGNSSRAVFMVANKMSEADPQAALSWALRLGSEQMQNEATRATMYRWGGQNGAAAMAYATDHLPADMQKDAMRTAISSWASNDAAAAMKYIDSTAPAALKSDLTSSAVRSWANYDSASAANYVSSMPTGPDRSRLTVQVSGQLARDNPQGAADWLTKQPAMQDLPQAYGQLAGNWFDTDIQGAATWVNSLPAGDNRDSALSNFSNKMAREDPATALQWASLVSKPEVRNSNQMNLVTQWARRDRAAAETWVQTQSGWAPQQVQDFMNKR